jgi:hypothetical protein
LHQLRFQRIKLSYVEAVALIRCVCTRAVWKVRALAAVRRCYADGGGDCYAKL